MKVSGRFLPLSLAFFLIATSGIARAGSTLDPYDYIKAPAGKKEKAAKARPELPAVDDVAEPKTYVNMSFKGVEDPDQQKKKGLLSKVVPKVPKVPGVGGLTAPIKTASSGVVKGGKAIGGGIASGAKAPVGLAKKGATVIGSGFK